MVRSFNNIFLVLGLTLGIETALASCEYEYRIPSMGTVFEIQITDECEKDHSTAIKTAKDILTEWESQFSLYQLSSPIVALNRDKILNNPSPIFIEGLQLAIESHSKTFGKFNIMVQPILQLVRKAFEKTNKPPKNTEITELRWAIDLKNLQITSNSILLKASKSAITLDGIVKGISVDKVYDQFSQYKFKGVLLNFSGNMRWSGVRADNSNWKIKAWNPVLQSTFDIKIPNEGSIASSGPEHNSFDEKYKWHHLIDPWILKPVNFWSQTTIVGPKATDCDVLSTASFVSDLKTIKRFKKAYPNYTFYLVDAKGIVSSY